MKLDVKKIVLTIILIVGFIIAAVLIEKVPVKMHGVDLYRELYGVDAED